MSYLLAALPGNLHWLFSPQQIHLNQCGTAEPGKSVRKCARCALKSPRSCNLGQTGGATAPPSCQRDEIRSRKKKKATLRTAASYDLSPGLEKKKKNCLHTPAITFLRANMSSLRSNFSYADVPSGVFFFLPPLSFLVFFFYKRLWIALGCTVLFLFLYSSSSFSVAL